MSTLQRIRWGRVAAAGAAIALVSWVGSSVDEDLSAHSHDIADADVAAADAEQAKPGDTTLLANRIWLDHMPRSQRDMTTQAIFIDKDGEKIGIVRRASTWRHLGELFRWEPRTGGLTLTFPQVDKSMPVSARAWACKDAPKGFDLCMEVSLLGKKARLYSNKKWTIRSGDVDATDLDAVVSGMITFDPGAVDLSVDDEALFESLQAQN